VTLRVHPDEIVAERPGGALGTHPSWSRIRLGAIADVLNGFAFPSSAFATSGTMPLIRIRDVGRAHTDTWYSGRFDHQYVVQPGSLIVGMDGEFRTDKWSGPPALLNQRVCKISVRNPALYDPDFLRHALPGYLDAVNRFTSAVTVKHLSSETIKELPLPLPPLSEQRRIVAAIEEQFSRIDAGVGALGRVRQNVDKMRSAVLQAAMTGALIPAMGGDVDALLQRAAAERYDNWHAQTHKPYRAPADPAAFPLAVPEHWRIASLEAMTDPIRVICYGILMPRVKEGGVIPYVEVKDLRAKRLSVTTLHRTSTHLHSAFPRSVLATGDVVLAIRGSYDRALVVPDDVAGSNVSRDVARIAPLTELNPDFLVAYLTSPPALKYLRDRARGVAVKGVNIADLRNMPVPLPPMDEQKRITEEVHRHLSILDQISVDAEHMYARSGCLRSSILAAAFSGRLVAQDAADEAAPVLLNRIAAEQAESNGRGASTRRTRLAKVTA
jgi:type I restriction enzyme S subunit